MIQHDVTKLRSPRKHSSIDHLCWRPGPIVPVARPASGLQLRCSNGLRYVCLSPPVGTARSDVHEQIIMYREGLGSI